MTIEDPPKTELYGGFNADYRFWKTEGELQWTLQHAVFWLVGIEWEKENWPGWRERGVCWIFGIILREVDRGGIEVGMVRRYKRIGWLRYCTRKKKEEWELRGVRSKFIII
jgi:hypothetical protein